MSNLSPLPVDQPVRFLVRHYHQPDPAQQREEVIVSYSADLKDGFSYAINTASRYNGVIYGEYPSEGYIFLRSYSEHDTQTEGAA